MFTVKRLDRASTDFGFDRVLKGADLKRFGVPDYMLRSRYLK